MTLKPVFDSFRALKPDAASSKKGDLAFLIFLLAVSLSVNAFLGWKITYRNQSIETKEVLVEGTSVLPITARNSADDREGTISFGNTNKPTVLYILTPSCVWCKRNLQNISTLASLRGGAYNFVGVSLADIGLKEYLGANKLGFPVYKNISAENIQRLKLGGTPQTIIISPEGKVLKNWVGAYQEPLKQEIEKYFNISLPGLDANQTITKN